ncbi:MAG: hypothetical protein GY714_30665 [Desulfobacterales bacterium]|nr:hypothetical protein [Desulfobacterales bacterium]
MKLNKKIKINILEFFQTGNFYRLILGKTKEWVLNNFPDPNYIGIGETLESAAIWRYGNLELHFDQQELFLIYSDYIEDLSGGKFLELDPWILGKTGDFSLERIMREFNTLRMDYTILSKLNYDMIELTITESQVKLTFHPEDDENDTDPNQFKLGSFSLMGS